MKDRNSEKRLTDRAFSQLFVSLILGIFICIICLCSATWALFSEDVVNHGNKIEAGVNELKISMTGQNGEAVDIEGEIPLAPGDYTVTLTLGKDSSSGYCIVRKGTQEYLAPYIKHHSEDEPKTVSFTLRLASEMALELEPRWGIYSSEAAVEDGGILVIE